MKKHFHHKQHRILFLIRKNFGYDGNYGGYSGTGAGLFNSCKFLSQSLKRHDLVKESTVVICIDGNSVDRELTIFKPDICIIEALWVTPEKLREVQKLHPKVRFIIRIHSNIPFLAQEGVAVGWIKQYETIPNVSIGFNNNYTTRDFRNIICLPLYLPNIYESQFSKLKQTDDIIDFGSFGAIRILKNQLIQAVAAINYADAKGQTIRFHINVNRTDGDSNGILKNIRDLFKGTAHQLVEHNWMNHEDFIEVVKQMDIGLQISFTESFNIISADFIYSGVPIVVSPEIGWMNNEAKASTTDAQDITNKIEKMLRRKAAYLKRARQALRKYTSRALAVWEEFLQII